MNTNASDFSALPALPYNVPANVLTQAANIKLALFDVDGVLTDGSLQYSHDGEQVKTFNALDGHGLKMLQQANIDVGIISARQSPALQRRLNDLNITHQYLGVNNKVEIFHQLLQTLSLKPEQACFTGDDVIDLAVMMQCGLKFSVSNGHFIAQAAADWVTPMAGGSGAARAVCDVLLYSQKKYPLNATHQQ